MVIHKSTGNGRSLFNVIFNSCCVSKIFILAVIIYIIQAVFVANHFFSFNHGVLGNFFICTLSFLAFISMILVYRKFPDNFPMEKRAKSFLIVAIGLFFLGDLLWLSSEIFLKNLVPIGSYPDLAWNFGYFALMASMIYLIRTEFIPSKKWMIVLLILGLLGGLAFLAQDISEDLESESFEIPHFFQDTYPFYDFILLGMTIVLLWPLIQANNRLFLGWIAIGLGLITRLVYDIIFIEMTEGSTYYTGHPVDLIYVLFYLAVIFNSVIKYSTLKNTK